MGAQALPCLPLRQLQLAVRGWRWQPTCPTRGWSAAAGLALAGLGMRDRRVAAGATFSDISASAPG